MGERTLWIMNHYAGHMLFDQSGRHYWFAKYLSRENWKIKVFCANVNSDNTARQHFVNDELYTEQNDTNENIEFIFVKARTYDGNGLSRIENMFDFYCNVKRTAKKIEEKYGRPDIILASSVHPLTLVAGIQLAKQMGIHCICEVRDLWPEAIVAYSKRIKKNSLIARIMYAGEKWIYKTASCVIFTQEGGPQYVIDQKWTEKDGGPIKEENLYHINNGVDLETFNENLESYHYEDKDIDDESKFKVVYAGAIRRINNLGIILDAAKCVKNTNVQFIIFGDGTELPMLKQRVIDEGITNVVFKGQVKRQYIPSIVTRADLNLVHWEMNPLLNVGESYNKAFEYFAAGQPVLYTIRPGYSIVEKYECGMIVDGFTPKKIAESIDAVASMDASAIQQVKENTKKVTDDYNFFVLTQKLISIIEKYI